MAAVGTIVGGAIAAGSLLKSLWDSNNQDKRQKDANKKVDQERGKLHGFGDAMAKKREEAEKGRTAPTMTAEKVDRSSIGNVSTQAGASSDLGKAMMDRAMGRGGPSVAEQQLKQSSERALAQQLAAGRASGSAAGMRQAQRAGQALQQGLAGEAATLRAQEQIAAQNAMLTQQNADIDRQLKVDMQNQGVDLDVLKTNAAAGNQAAMANLEAALKARGLDDAQIKTYINAELGARQSAAGTIPQAQQADNSLAAAGMQAGGAILGSVMGS